MAVESPHFDSKPRGGSDLWDDETAGAVMRSDWFTQSTTPSVAALTFANGRIRLALPGERWLAYQAGRLKLVDNGTLPCLVLSGPRVKMSS